METTPAASIKNRLKDLLCRSRILTYAAYLANALWFRLRRYAGETDSSSGTPHAAFDLEASMQYIHSVFEDYKTYSGLTAFRGRVAELGPGDNAGVGLLFLHNGCTSVELVDRFYASRDPLHQARIYAELGRRHPRIEEILRGKDLQAESWNPQLRWSYGEGAAAETYFLDHGTFDYIVSRAVLEHAYDPRQALLAMAGALGPGGMMLHKVDLGDHAMFSARGHELAWLETPETLHRWMTRANGWPNRVLAHNYRAILEETGLSFTLLVSRLAGGDEIIPHLSYEEIPLEERERALAEVRKIAPRLARSLSKARIEDLSITGIFMVATKLPKA